MTPDTQLFRDVFNSSPIGIAVENLDGQPLFVNPAFCSFLGFSEEELRSAVAQVRGAAAQNRPEPEGHVLN